MAATNPWGKRTARAPRHEAPRQAPDPFARFSKSPTSLATIDNFRNRLATQGKLNPNGKIPAAYRTELLASLASVDLIESPSLEDLKDDAHLISYKRRADSLNKLTEAEAISLVDHSIDQVVTGQGVGPAIRGNDISDLESEYLKDKENEYEALPGTAQLQPYLVNVSWHYDIGAKQQGKRKSPPVVYSIEGVFYATSEEEAIVAGHRFIVDHIRPAVSGRDGILDMANDAPEGTASSGSLMEAVGAQTREGLTVTKKQAEDEAFDPAIRAFFRRGSRESLDENYRDPGIKYRIVKGHYEVA